MKAIVVADSNWGIGKNGGLLFRLPKDMAFFRSKTLHKTVVMGARTYASFSCGALKERKNIVLDDSGKTYADALSVSTEQQLLALLGEQTDDVFVIGGASVYKLLLKRCDEVFVTKVDADGNADCFFPNLDKLPDWYAAETSDPVFDNGFTLRFCTYRKK